MGGVFDIGGLGGRVILGGGDSEMTTGDFTMSIQLTQTLNPPKPLQVLAGEWSEFCTLFGPRFLYTPVYPKRPIL